MQACGRLVARMGEQDVDRDIAAGIEIDGGDMALVMGDLDDPAIDDGYVAARQIGLDLGRNVAVDILFAQPRNKPSASLHELLGLATVDTPGGIALKVDERRQTSMPGIYAAGDLTTTFLPSATQASSHGAMAGIFAQQSMVV